MATNKSITVALDSGNEEEVTIVATGGQFFNTNEDMAVSPFGYAESYASCLTGTDVYIGNVKGKSSEATDSYITDVQYYKFYDSSTNQVTFTFRYGNSILTYDDIGYLKIYNPSPFIYKLWLVLDETNDVMEECIINTGYNEVFIYLRKDLDDPLDEVKLLFDATESTIRYSDDGSSNWIPLILGKCTYQGFSKQLTNCFTSFDLTELYSVEATPSNSCTFTYVADPDTNWTWTMDDAFKVFYDGEYYGTFYVNQLDTSAQDSLITIKGNDVFYTMGSKTTAGMVFETPDNATNYGGDLTYSANFCATLYKVMRAFCQEGQIDLDYSSIDNTVLINGYHAKRGNSIRDEILKICLLQGKSPRVGRGTFTVETLGEERNYGVIDNYVFDGHTENEQSGVNNIAIRSISDWTYDSLYSIGLKRWVQSEMSQSYAVGDITIQRYDEWRRAVRNIEFIPMSLNWVDDWTWTLDESETTTSWESVPSRSIVGCLNDGTGYARYPSANAIGFYTGKYINDAGESVEVEIDNDCFYRYTTGYINWKVNTLWSQTETGKYGVIYFKEFPDDSDWANIQYQWTYTDATNDEYQAIYLEGIPYDSSVLTTIHNYYYKIKCWNKISFQTAMDVTTNSTFTFEGRSGLIEQVSHDLINGINSVNGYIQPF